MHDQFTNRLINESSPYLLQHAHNPVDWFAWGEEALAKAKAESKIILVSIGYSACHWCHVMERESFENTATAQVMNEHFVNVKIDREERPDLDHIYMDAVQAISGSGGWPLNVFLTPDAKPFFGGTYFPPVKAFNRSSWTEVLHGISQAWKERKDEIISQADYLTEHLKKSNNLAQTTSTLSFETGKIATIEECEAMFAAIMKTADTGWGGFGKAPKFPQTFTIQFLLQYHYFTGNEDALQQALLSIDKMLTGGIYDQIGGGLARYSTDDEWLAPHFEKMLYDNALLTNILCDAYQITGAEKYADAIHKTIAFVKNELLSPEGGFYAALDADSEGEEGKYYVWEKAEIDQILGADSTIFCAYFDVTEDGNWEERNILRTLKTTDEFIKEHGISEEDLTLILQRCSEKLLKQRSTRVKPALDDKIILGWNALMLKAVAKAAVVLDKDSYRKMAAQNFDFLERSFKKDVASFELSHTYKNGRANYPAFLDDYANLIAALIQLYKTNFEETHLETAFEYCNYVIENFSDEEGIFFFFTHFGQKDVIVRKKEIYDGATPSGNSVMAENLYQLAILFDKMEWKNRADNMLATLLPTVTKYLGSFGIWATLLMQQLAETNEIVVIGTDFVTISNKILLNFIPNMVIMSAFKENKTFPLLANKSENTSSLVYLCKNYTCLSPFLSAEALLKKVEQTNKITR